MEHTQDLQKNSYQNFLNETVKELNEREERNKRSEYEFARYLQQRVEIGVSMGKTKSQIYSDLKNHKDFKLSVKTLKKYEITQRFLDDTGGSPASLPITTVTEIAEAKLSLDQKKEMLASAGDSSMTRKEVRTEIKKKQRENIETHAPVIPEGEFNVLYADPPWKYDFAETTNRDIENHYPTMELTEICAMELPKLSTDSVLFLWATAPKLEEALEVMHCWGFKYKTQMVWDKQKIGMGYWFRGQHEILIVGTRGHVSPPIPEVRIGSVYSEARTQHSKKPDYFYSLIESYFPRGKYVELFARQSHPNWSVYGNQA